jgi:DNA (cytosine-5)-methyltransferase 1
VRYLSVCSGIEAASVAWHALGWTPVGFSEIEPFPSAVLAHRFPNVPNFGDMTKYKEWPLEPGSIDLLVGGTPCQSFSVAGLRKGLSDPRGGLMLTYLEIAQRLRPRWVVWENVPGVLSSGGGRDFGSFLGALGELGYGWAYRVLDAQWVRTHGHPRAVPQRRRRVFVVGRLIERGAGDWNAAAEVLLESQSVRRNNQAQRETRKEAPSDAARCFAGSSESGVAAALETTCHDYSRADGFNTVVQPAWPADVSPTLNQSARGSGAPGYSDQEIFAQGAGCLVPQPVPFRKAKRAQSALDDETWVPAQQANTLNGFDTGERDTHAVAFPIDGRNALRDADKLDKMNRQGMGIGDPSDPSHTVTSACVHAVAFNWQNGGGYGNANEGLGITIEGTGPLQRCNTPAVAHALRGEGFDASENGTGRGTPLVTPQPMTVRRLTAKECERLQGFPDDWTLIPWRGKPAADCPDGPRYKALGNSMAVNCMEWIGQRIAAVDSSHAKR